MSNGARLNSGVRSLLFATAATRNVVLQSDLLSARRHGELLQLSEAPCQCSMLLGVGLVLLNEHEVGVDRSQKYTQRNISVFTA